MVGGMLFSSRSASEIPSSLSPYGGVDYHFSIVSTDLSFAPFSEWDEDSSHVMIGIEFDPLGKKSDEM
jgi:hypothetical protein